MKTRAVVLFLTMMFLVFSLLAQTKGPNTQTETPDRIWLQNGEKEVVALNGDTVSAEYFQKGQLVLFCSRALLPDEVRVCVVQPTNGKQAVAFFMHTHKLTPEVIKAIGAAGSGSSLTFVVQPKNGFPPNTEIPDPFLHLTLK